MMGPPNASGDRMTMAPADDPVERLSDVVDGGTEAPEAEGQAQPAAQQQATPGLTPPRRRGHSGRFITDVLVELGLVTQEQVEHAIQESREAGRAPEDLLLEQGAINADQLSRAMAERYGLDYVDLNVYQVDMAAANLVSVSAARRTRAVPVGHVDKDTLLLAMADPANVLAVDDIQMATGLNCRVAVAAPGDIDALISRLNTLSTAVSEAVDESEGGEEEGQELTDMRASAEDAPVIKLVFSVLGQAANEGASDVHFEPEEDGMRVRFRVDGVLREAAHVPKRMVSGVVSRIKIMSELDIAEKRVPQDGRVSVNVEDRRVDLRVTTLPTQRGEGATIRILDKASSAFSLDEVGMDGEARKRFEHAFRQSYGAVLVTGPTGSGKSTTLYGALQELNEVEKKIITIEDPVEYRLAGINQINVNAKAGLTFATGLRSVLRADPDIIMVGEIRDADTARIAIESALTGHMVLSTLHTNDAPGAVTRLTKMGIESFLTASAVDCVVAQRLARTLCSHCKRETTLSQEALLQAGFRVDSDIQAYEPVGCTRCAASGYRGRLGLFSVMVMSEMIKDMAVSLASESEIAQAARQEGMKTVKEDGLDKVREGLTSIEEVSRVAT
jgi:type IV pilus assembly protein PilB